MSYNGARPDTCPGCGAPLAAKPGGKMQCHYCGRTFETVMGVAGIGLSLGLDALKQKRKELSEKFDQLEQLKYNKGDQKPPRFLNISGRVKGVLIISLLAVLVGALLQSVFLVMAGIFCFAAVFLVSVYRSGLKGGVGRQSVMTGQYDAAEQELGRLKKEIDQVSRQIEKMELGD